MMTKQIKVVFSCYFLLAALIGVFYIPNGPNFGKSIVELWGIVALVLACAGIVVLWIKNQRATRIICVLMSAIQLPPVWCWMIFMTDRFAGMPGWLGFAIHAVLFVWGLINIAKCN